MLSVLLLLIVAGIGLAQAVSSPAQVTLRWLRLGGVVGLSLLAVGFAVDLMTDRPIHGAARLLFLLAFLAVIGQLTAAQMGRRTVQRTMAACLFIMAGLTAGLGMGGGTQAAAGTFVGGGLLGGFLMTMLLGHAYLTAGSEMTQAPFLRLVAMLAVLLVLRLLMGLALGLLPWWTVADGAHVGDPHEFARLWAQVLITARFAVGLIVPMVFTYMVWDCVRRRANQSATGILYVACVLVLIGEGLALALMGTTGLPW